MILYTVSEGTSNQLYRLTTDADTIVPESNVILLPLIADMDLLCSGDDFIEVTNDRITLSLRHSNDARHKSWIEKERFPSGNRMSANKRVLRNNRISTNGAASGDGPVCLHSGRMESAKTFQILLHGC